MTELQNLPSGWEARFDEISGRYYYINHATRSTSWDDPRSRANRQYLPSTPKHFSNIQVEHIPLQEIRSIPRMSPLTLRGSKVQDSSFTVPVTSTDGEAEAVAKIGAMFPTVSETHIKLLMKNCRYMKSIFPQADETVILDILQNNDNNIQKTSDALKDMGFNKRDTVKLVQQKAEEKVEEQKKKEKVAKAAVTPPSQPKIKTTQEKSQIKQKLQEDYKDVAEHLITIALESVNFDEKRANQILKIMIREDTEAANNKQKTESQAADTEVDSALLQPSCSKSDMPVSQSRQSLKSLLKSEKNEKEINTFSRVIEENGNTCKSKNICSTKGHNTSYAKGPNENLLLEDYIKWYGPNPNLRSGSQNIAKGPNKDLLSKRSYQPCGPNAALRKGPMFSRVKAGVFGQLKAVAVGDGRHE